jgi:hypothetical protein
VPIRKKRLGSRRTQPTEDFFAGFLPLTFHFWTRGFPETVSFAPAAGRAMVFVPAGTAHEAWNPFDEPAEFIILMFGQGA